MATQSPDHFRTVSTLRLGVDLQGIPGDRHYGFTRCAGAREGWFECGSEIRSGRQLSLVSREDLQQIATAMNVAAIQPEWIGANILIEAVPDFTRLPWGTRLFFEGGAVLVNEGLNVPCKYAGREVAAHYPDRVDLDRLFVKCGKNLRGIVATVEQAGSIMAGPVNLKIPEQKIWTGGKLI
jgi:hypothetical protein